MTIKVKLLKAFELEDLESAINQFLKGIRDDDVRDVSIFQHDQGKLVARIEYRDRKKGEALSSKTDVGTTGPTTT